MVEALAAIGWKAKTIGKHDIDEGLRQPGDVVVVAGGDGTVGKVAKRLAGTGVPMAVIPTGTANNVARTLGVGVDARAAILGLRRAVERDVDLGVVTCGAPAGARFVEGFGVGIFAWVMAERATKKHKKLRRALDLIATELEDYEPSRTRIEADGRDHSGTYLMVAVMNLRSLGPALAFAPEALFDDGKLDLVLVHPEERESLRAHLRRAANEGDITLPRFEVRRVERVRLGGYGGWAHLDDVSHAFDGDVEVQVDPGAVRCLIPPRGD
jgi:diacylglycerol kinase family enzyme